LACFDVHVWLTIDLRDGFSGQHIGASDARIGLPAKAWAWSGCFLC
jgi:hypothetical protein